MTSSTVPTLPQATDAELEAYFHQTFGVANLYNDIAWLRCWRPFHQEQVSEEWLAQQLRPLCQLLGKPQRILFPESMEEPEKALGASLGDSPRDSLWDSLWDSPRDSLWASPRDSLWASLGDSLGASLGDSLGASVWASLRDSLWASLGDSLWYSLRHSLRYSLWDSLRASLRASLWHRSGLVLAGRPHSELDALLQVWSSGALVLGFSDQGLLVLTRERLAPTLVMTRLKGGETP